MSTTYFSPFHPVSNVAGSRGTAQVPAAPNVIRLSDTVTGAHSIEGNTITKLTNNLSWAQPVYSSEFFSGNAHVSGVLASSGTMFGLTDARPIADYNTNMDYGFYRDPNVATDLYTWNGTTFGLISGSYPVTAQLLITYNGYEIEWYIDGILKNSVVTTENRTFWLSSSIYRTGASINNLQFGPFSSDNWASIVGPGKAADNATVGAVLGTNLKDSGGTVQGDSAVKNSFINIGVDGVLAGGGGGQVTIGGLGFVGELGATTSDNLIVNAGLYADSSSWGGITNLNRIIAGSVGANDPGNFFQANGTNGSAFVNNTNTQVKSLPAGARKMFVSSYVHANNLNGYIQAIISFFDNGQLSVGSATTVNLFPNSVNTWTLCKGSLDIPAKAVYYQASFQTQLNGGTIVNFGNPRLAFTEASATLGSTWGTDLVGRPTNIAALVGTEGIQNTLVNISAGGALAGAGGGQITVAGLETASSVNIRNTRLQLQADSVGTGGRGRFTLAQEGAGFFTFEPPSVFQNLDIGINSGLITGIGAGTNTAVANSLISLSSGGALTGGSGGQVTLTGIGFAGDPNATAADAFNKDPNFSNTALPDWGFNGLTPSSAYRIQLADDSPARFGVKFTPAQLSAANVGIFTVVPVWPSANVSTGQIYPQAVVGGTSIFLSVNLRFLRTITGTKAIQYNFQGDFADANGYIASVSSGAFTSYSGADSGWMFLEGKIAVPPAALSGNVFLQIVAESNTAANFQHEIYLTNFRYGRGATGATVGATWSTDLFGRPTNIAALSGGEGIQNTLVSISPAGALSGAGGGQVLLGSGGLGYLGALNAGSTLTFSTLGTGMAVSGNSVSRTVGGGTFGGASRSIQTYVGTAFVSFKAPAPNPGAGTGLLVGFIPSGGTPATGTADFSAAVSCRSDGTLGFFKDGAQITTGNTYVAGSEIALTYDGVLFEWYLDGTLIRTETAAANLSLRLKTAHHDIIAVSDLIFGPYTENVWNSLGVTRPTNLAALLGSEGINNTLVNISAGGALAGAGGGQITVAGLETAGSINIRNTRLQLQADSAGVGGRGRFTLAQEGSGFFSLEAPSVMQNFDIGISAGLITGIGTGTNTAVGNSLISLSATGALAGGSGGQVLLGAGGLGYLGDLNATNDLLLEVTAGSSITIKGNGAKQAGGDGNYGFVVSTRKSIAGPCFIEANISTVGSTFTMIALDTDFAQSAFTDMGVFLHFQHSTGAWNVYTNGATAASGNVGAGYIGKISLLFDGAKVHAYASGVLLATITPPGAFLSNRIFANWTLYNINVDYSGFAFGNAAERNWQNFQNRPSNLVALSGSEGINNASVTVSAAGALSGAGGGQVTSLGLHDAGQAAGNTILNRSLVMNAGRLSTPGWGNIFNDILSNTYVGLNGIQLTNDGGASNLGAVANSGISISAAGALTGGSGGQVQLTSLGFTGYTGAGKVSDTRNTDELPSYYYANPFNEFQDFKTANFAGSGSTGFGHLISISQWTDPSGGPVKQTLTDSDGVIFERRSTSSTTWGAWVKNYNGNFKPAWTADINSRPSNLAALSGGEGITNSLVSISPAGALTGAGGGQVTIGGLGFKGSLMATAGRELVVNGNAEQGNARIYYADGNGNTTVSVDPSFRSGGSLGFAINKPSTPGFGAGFAFEAIACKPFQRFVVRINLNGSAATANGLYIRMLEKTNAPANGSYIPATDITSLTDLVANGPIPASATNYTYIYTVPAGVVFFSPSIYNWDAGPTVMRFDEYSVQELSNWSSDVDGRPSNLASLAGSEGILNSSISISASGGLSNAGGGSVTISGLGYSGELNADLSVQFLNAVDQTIQATSAGVPKTGQLARVLNLKMMRNGLDVTAATTWSVSILSGTSTASIGANTGALTINASGGVFTTTRVRVTTVNNGYTRGFELLFTREDDPPTAGSSAGGGTSANGGLSGSVNTTVAPYVVISPELSMNVGSNGTTTLTTPQGSFTADASSGPQGSFEMRFRWQWWNGSAWADIGSEVVSSSPCVVEYEGEFAFYYILSEGTMSVSLTHSGLTAGSAQKYRLTARVSTARALFPAGSGSAVGS